MNEWTFFKWLLWHHTLVFLLPPCLVLLCLLCRLIFLILPYGITLSLHSRLFSLLIYILFPWVVLSITFNYHPWQIALPKDSHIYVFIPPHMYILQCNWYSSTEKWGLSSLPLNLGGSLWHLWPMKCGGIDTIWLLRLGHVKDTVSTWLSLGIFAFGINPFCCKEAQATWRGHMWMLQPTAKQLS